MRTKHNGPALESDGTVYPEIIFYARPKGEHIHSNKNCPLLREGQFEYYKYEPITLVDAGFRALRVCACVNDTLCDHHRLTISSVKRIVRKARWKVKIPITEKRPNPFKACVRYGNMTMDEEHPCYICGFPIPVTLEYCKCGIIRCPRCGACACPSSMTPEVFEALVKLRNKYCCNPINFAKGIDHHKDGYLLKLVPNYETAFNYCRNLEILSAAEFDYLDL